MELATKMASIDWASEFVRWNDLIGIEREQMANSYLPIGLTA